MIVTTLDNNATNLNHLGQSVCGLETVVLDGRNITAANSTFAIGGVSCSADSFVVAESFVLRINICGKNLCSRFHIRCRIASGV